MTCTTSTYWWGNKTWPHPWSRQCRRNPGTCAAIPSWAAILMECCVCAIIICICIVMNTIRMGYWLTMHIIKMGSWRKIKYNKKWDFGLKSHTKDSGGIWNAVQVFSTNEWTCHLLLMSVVLPLHLKMWFLNRYYTKVNKSVHMVESMVECTVECTVECMVQWCTYQSHIPHNVRARPWGQGNN